MRLAMIGSGYVGLVSGACLAEFGNEVCCVDRDQSRTEQLNRGEMPIYEPGLDQLVGANVSAGRLSFTTDLKSAVQNAEIVFIAVGTPAGEQDGKADLSYVYGAAEEIGHAIQNYTVVVTKSTVPVGTGREVERIIRGTKPKAEFDVVSNPEFLREGSAINDFVRPDRVIIGTESERAQNLMRRLYRPLYLIEKPIVFTDIETAELTKYAANAFLATKITFINEIADLCEKVGGDVHAVARGIGLDGRIGRKFLHPGPGYGGSCFPKDTQALANSAREFGAPVRIVETVIDVNETRKAGMAQRVMDACDGSVQGKRIAVLGLTFKPNTDDMREAPSLEIVPKLQAAGAEITAFDPEGMEEAKKRLENVVWCDDAYEALDGAHAMVIVTEWNQFRSLDLERAKSVMKEPVMVDLRNVYSPQDVVNAGFRYRCVGRPVLERK